MPEWLRISFLFLGGALLGFALHKLIWAPVMGWVTISRSRSLYNKTLEAYLSLDEKDAGRYSKAKQMLDAAKWSYEWDLDYFAKKSVFQSVRKIRQRMLDK